MENALNCRVDFLWDDEASVWVATSKDVPGLVLESGSFDALVERVRHAVPELLILNHQSPAVIKYTYSSMREDRVPMYG